VSAVCSWSVIASAQFPLKHDDLGVTVQAVRKYLKRKRRFSEKLVTEKGFFSLTEKGFFSLRPTKG
jgi:predicted transcriptional regulator